MIAFIGECELKTRDELPEHVLTSGMASYVKKKQDTLLNEDEVKAIVEQIKSNKFSKSWRTNRAHKAYLKDKHSPSNKQPPHHSDSKIIIKPNSKAELNSKVTTAETIKSREVLKNREALKSREVLRWSGQMEVEQIDIPIIPPSNREPSAQLTSKDSVYLTPFDVFESEPKLNEPFTIEQVDALIVSSDMPICPKCHSKMIERVAKKGARQGQTFYGCSQFPKCRGLVNIE